MIKYKSKIIKKIREGIEQGGGIHSSTRSAGINPATLWRWRKKYPRIDRYFDSITEHRVQLVEDALFKNAIQGNIVAQKFFLSVHRPNKYKEQPLVDNSTHITKVTYGWDREKDKDPVRPSRLSTRKLKPSSEI